MSEATIADVAPRDIRDALLDSQYRAGAIAGWNAAMIIDPEASRNKIAALTGVEAGALEPLRKGRAALATKEQDHAV